MPRRSRTMGWSSRAGLPMISLEACPRTQRNPWLSGLSGSPLTDRTRPSSISTSIPQSVGWQFIGHIVRTTVLIAMLRPPAPSRAGEGRRTGRRSAMTRRLLIRIGQLDQQRLAPRASQQLDADRQAIGREAAGHDDRRQAGIGAEVTVGAGLLLAGHVRLAADRRIGEGVEPVVGHRLEDRLPQGVALDDVLEVLL